MFDRFDTAKILFLILAVRMAVFAEVGFAIAFIILTMECFLLRLTRDSGGRVFRPTNR